VNIKPLRFDFSKRVALSEVIKMGKRIDEICKLLDELEVNYKLEDETIVARWKTEKWNNLIVNFIFSPNEIWLTIVGWRKFPKLGKKGKTELYKKLLQESWNFNGVKYTLDPDGDIAVAVETADIEITREELARYIKQVLNAADELYDWAPAEVWTD
jgi:hypothetical protein